MLAVCFGSQLAMWHVEFGIKKGTVRKDIMMAKSRGSMSINNGFPIHCLNNGFPIYCFWDVCQLNLSKSPCLYL